MSSRPPRPVPQPRALRPARANAGTLLLEAYRRFERELFDELHRAGHAALRPKHGAVLANVDRDGTRATELAARAGMTKASMGELVDELERLGYVRRAADPQDRRAKRVVPTAAGLEVARLARAAIAGLERRWAGRIGEGRFRALLAALEALASAPP
ncbi:MarR family winged helix-turn-helix transcriptional regulator [Anaeromyxobacter sp. PSR-1]|uniref:MarR family winged helix-turn-helix transcriptional regulator n=1 Tax=Anaeromyxobacter sp. PSR-1 TaxID=1300915 RepID=UPI0005DFF34E|nr:MarR family transcriptional regulator [Anaeromyxobacter sp. PSR-1]GAO05359.1 marR family protein [Anaeromyxobacter sp. PSR-1]